MYVQSVVPGLNVSGVELVALSAFTVAVQVWTSKFESLTVPDNVYVSFVVLIELLLTSTTAAPFFWTFRVETGAVKSVTIVWVVTLAILSAISLTSKVA